MNLHNKKWFYRIAVLLLMALAVAGCSDDDDDNAARLRVIHLSYDAPNVDVTADDAEVVMNLAYRSASTYRHIDAGDRRVMVTPTGADTPVVIDAIVTLDEDAYYSLLALNDLANIEPLLVMDDRMTTSDKARVRFVHAAPDAPSVDIKLDTGDGPAVFSGRSFRSVSTYSAVDGGTYTFVVTAAGSTEPVVTFNPAMLENGQIYTIAAYGTLAAGDAYPFGVRVFVDTGDGDAFVDLTERAAPETARLRVIHGSYDAPGVDVRVDDAVAISGLAYTNASTYLAVEAGTRNVKVSPAGATTPIVIEANLDLMANTDYTVYAVNDLAMIEAVVSADPNAPDPSRAKVRFVHAAPDAPAVDIRQGSGSGPAVFANQPFKSVTDYVGVDGGTYTFVVTPAGSTGELVRFMPVTLENGGVYTVFAYGTLDESDNFPFGVKAFVDSGDGNGAVTFMPQGSAEIRVIHASYDAPAVDVAVEGMTAVTNLPFPNASPYATISAGTRRIEVFPAGQTGAAVISADLTFMQDTAYTVYAMNELALIGPVVTIDERLGTIGVATVRFAHGAPDAPAVDIRLESGSGTPVFGNVGFKEVAEYITVNPGAYTFAVTAAGMTDEVVRFEPVTLESGRVYTILAHGTLAEDAYPFAARMFTDAGAGNLFTDLQPAVAPEVRVIHLSYDAPAVDVLVDDAGGAISNLAYLASSGYAALASGTRNIKVTPASDPTTVVIDADVPFENGKRYTIFAVNALANIGATQVEDGTALSAGQGAIRLFHASPDTPAVDLRLADGTPLFSNAAFNQPTDYLPVAAGQYDLIITAAGDTTPLFLLNGVPVAEGGVLTVAAYGTLDATDAFPFGVIAYAETGAGDQATQLPLATANVMAIHASPDAPGVDLLVDNAVAGTDLEFPNNTGYLGTTAGRRNLKINVTGSDVTVIEADLDFMPNSSTSVFAINTVANIEPLVFTDDLTAPASGNAHVRFIHLSPDAPSVDITLTDGTVLFGNISFRESDNNGAFTPLAAGTYDLQVRAAGTETVVLDLPGVTLEDGRIYTIFARGLLAGTGAQALGAEIIVNVNP